MTFQKVLKGIPELDEPTVISMLAGGIGIQCNWWRRVRQISPQEMHARLSDPVELDRHLRRYGQYNHAKRMTNGEDTPYISTTAGVVQPGKRAFLKYPALQIALRFATRTFTCDGWVFRGWLEVAPKPGGAIDWLAEEVRDANQYSDHYWHHHQGEVTAKVHIPTFCIERAERYEAHVSWGALLAGVMPTPSAVLDNPNYIDPATMSNIREVVA